MTGRHTISAAKVFSYLSRGGTVDTAVPPGLACTTSGIALTTVGC
jgi:hypothetical protein